MYAAKVEAPAIPCYNTIHKIIIKMIIIIATVIGIVIGLTSTTFASVTTDSSPTQPTCRAACLLLSLLLLS